jgi:hypothetical protein
MTRNLSGALTHDQLCRRALTWLRGTRRCEPVFSHRAACAEIPDAIGWSSHQSWRGSTIVECKTCMSDFYADQKKRTAYRHPETGFLYDRGDRRRWEALGYEQITLPRMGDFRFYLCELDLLTAELVTEKAPDHGLLYVVGRQIRIIVPAPRRLVVDHQAEIRYLCAAVAKRQKIQLHSTTAA